MDMQQAVDDLSKFATQVANLTFGKQEQKVEIRDMIFLKMIDCLQFEGTEQEKRAVKQYYQSIRKEIIKEHTKEFERPNINSMF